MGYLIKRVQVMLTSQDYYRLRLEAADKLQSVSSLARNIICNKINDNGSSKRTKENSIDKE